MLEITFAIVLLGGSGGHASMPLEDYQPRSTLVVPEHPTPRARYAFVDIHSHHEDQLSDADVDRIVAEMDAMNMAVLINLDGGWGEQLEHRVAMLELRYPDRFLTFANIDIHGIDEPDFGERAADQLEADVQHGAAGVTISNDLGLHVRDSDGNRVTTDDPRLDPVWTRAARLGVPVVIHTGDPIAFWSAVDEHNERWLELTQFPGARRRDPQFASFEQTIAEQHSLFRRHPDTTFIAAHLGWLGNDLAALGRLLDELPNVHADLAAAVHELGRQPRAAREFLIRYQDRVLMGKETWAPPEYPVYFRILETSDEYFDYPVKEHVLWKMYGLELPDRVLQKIYFGNAARLLPQLQRMLPGRYDRG